MNLPLRQDNPHLKLSDAAFRATKGDPLGGIVMLWPDDGSAITSHDLCRCTNTRKRTFADCCQLWTLSPEAHMDADMGVYLGRDGLWPNDPFEAADVYRLVERFDPSHLVQVISRISTKLQDDYLKPASPEELEVLRIFLPADWLDKTTRWLISKKRTKVFHRLLFPAMLLQVFAHADRTTKELRSPEDKERVGELALMFNQIIEEDYQAQVTAAKGRPDIMRALYASVYRQAFYAQSESYADSLGRTWGLIKKGLPAIVAHGHQGFEFESLFEREFGFTVEDMFAYGFAVWTHYSSDNAKLFEGPTQFVLHRKALHTVVLPERQEASERIFDYLALTFEEHAARARASVTREGVSPLNMYQLYSLYDRPLVKMPDGAIHVLDTQFLRARITEGAYWAVFDTLSRDDRERMKEAFGHAVEWYASEVLRASQPKDLPKQLWLDWDSEITVKGEKTKRPDAALLEGDTLFLMEITTSTVIPQVASSGDPDLLADAITKVWFGKKPGDSAKLRQLAAAMDAFWDERLVIKGLNPRAVKQIRPVLVSFRDFPQWPKLMDWYRDLMKDNRMTPEFIRDFVLLDIEELEEMAHRLLHGETWTSILAQKALAPNPDVSTHNFLYRTGRIETRHPYVDALKNEAVQSFKERIGPV